MANIDELHFQVILDDTAFQQKIATIEQAAKRLNTTVTQLLQIQAAITATSDADVRNALNHNKILRDNARTQEQIQRAVDRTAAANARNAEALRRTREGVDIDLESRRALAAERLESASIRTATAQARLNKVLKEGNTNIFGQSRLLRDMVTMAGSYISLMGATRLVKNLVQVSAEFELQRTTLAAILQDVEQANKLYGQMKELAVVSPFNFKDLSTYAKQLSAYSIPVNELYETTRMLADVSAGLGVDMNRLVLAYGQIRSASFLRGQEVRQLTEAGIPILEELRKQFEEMTGVAITAGDVFDKISARQVPFEMVAKVFKDMTSEGGKFYRMQEIQADTLKGKLSNLVDAYQIMFSEIGENQDGFLKGSVDTVRKMIENYQTLGRVLITVAASFGMFKTTSIIADLAKWYAGFDKIGARARAMGVQVSNANIILHTFARTMKGLGAGLTVAAFTALAMGIYQAAKAAHELERSLDKIGQTRLTEAEKSVRTFEELLRSMESMTQGSQDYRDAIAQLNRQYGEYLPNLLTEKTSLDEIRALSESVTQSIYNRAKAYAMEQGIQEINERYVKTQLGYTRAITQWLGSLGVGENKSAAVLARFREEIIKVGDSSQSYSVFIRTLKDFFGQKTFTGIEYMSGQARELGRAFIDADKATRSYSSTLDAMYGRATSFSTSAEMDAVKAINDRYTAAKNAVNAQRMDADQTDAEIKKLEVARVTELISYYERLGDEDQHRLDMVRKYKGELESMTQTLTGWQAKVNGILTENGLGRSSAGKLWATESDGLIEYWDTLRKTYKEVYRSNDEMESLKKNNYELYLIYVNQRKAIEAIGKALGVSVDDKLKKTGRSGKSPEQVAIEARIDELKSYMSTYKQLQSLGFGDNAIREIFKAYTDLDEETRNTLGFADALNRLADELENVYGEAKAAGAVRRFVSGKDIKDITDGYNRLLSLRDKMQDLLTQDFNISGRGIVFDINKLAAELNTKNNKVDLNLEALKTEFREALKNEEALKVIREKYGSEAWAAYLSAGESALEELADSEKSYNREVAMERIRDLAKNYLKEWDDLKAFDLSDWSDKTIVELNDLKAVIDSFDISRLPQELKDAIVAAAGDKGLLEFLRVFQEGLDELGKKTDEQLKKERIERVKDAANAFGELADTGTRVAEAYGKSTLGAALTMMKDLAATASTVFESYMTGDYLTMSITIFNQFLKFAELASAATHELQNAIAEAAEEARRMNAELSLEKGVGTLFGDNSTRALQNAVNLLREVGRLTEEDMDRTKVFNKAWGSVRGTLTFKKWGVDLQRAVEDLGYELTDEYGNLNATALQAILDTYKNLDKESRDWLTHAINDSELYAEAMEQLKDAVKDVFGTLADDMADTLIDEYMQIGDATVDLAENMDGIFGDLAQSIAKNLISAFIIDNVLDKYRSEVEDFYRQMGEGNLSEEQIAAYFSTLAEGIRNDTETAAEYTNRLLDALKEQGIALTEQSTGRGLANGIQGVTEDTANLLASYINAIRADVSASRVTLTDIQTNTFRSAIAAEGILARMESVIGSFSGGGDGIKVVMQ